MTLRELEESATKKEVSENKKDKTKQHPRKHFLRNKMICFLIQNTNMSEDKIRSLKDKTLESLCRTILYNRGVKDGHR